MEGILSLRDLLCTGDLIWKVAEGRLPDCTDPQGGQALPTIHVEREKVAVQISTLQPGHRTKDIYETPQAGGGAPETTRTPCHHLLR